MQATVSTPLYEGPIETLLQLVNSHEVDLYEIPLADLVDGFVAHMATWTEPDLAALSEFVVVASVLIELKSKRLLPGPDDVEQDEELIGWEERDLLLARLLECQAYSAAADTFALLMEQASRSIPRTAGLDPDVQVHGPDLLEGVSPDQLADAFLKATAERPAPVVDLFHVTVDSVTVADTVAEFRRRLPRVGRTNFRALTQHLTTRIEVIVSFLALLELCKQGRVQLDQGHSFGDLEIVWLDGGGLVTSENDAIDEYQG